MTRTDSAVASSPWRSAAAVAAAGLLAYFGPWLLLNWFTSLTDEQAFSLFACLWGLIALVGVGWLAAGRIKRGVAVILADGLCAALFIATLWYAFATSSTGWD